jgi:signal transduction histidine kinase/DNA-binding response OmpR family regulator/HAMP domain-containing protein
MRIKERAMLRNLKIGTRLWGSFGILLFITLIIGIIAIQSLNKLSALTSDMYTKPLVISNAVRDIKINIGRIRNRMITIGLTEINHDQDIALMEQSLTEINEYEQEIFSRFSLIKDRFQGSQALVDVTTELMRIWKPLRDEEIKLAKTNKQTKLIAAIKGRGAKLVGQILENMHKLKIYSNKQAINFLEESNIQRNNTITFMATLLGLLICSGSVIAFYITRGVTTPLRKIQKTTEAIAGGELHTDIGLSSSDEIGQLANAVMHMQGSLRDTYQQNRNASWHKDSLAKLNNLITGNPTLKKLTSDVITELCHLLDAKIGTIYILDDSSEPPVLIFTAGFGHVPNSDIKSQFIIGEGLVGQAGEEQQPILINNPPSDYLKIHSSLGDSPPNQIAIFPCYHKKTLMAVIEIGLLDSLTELKLSFLAEAIHTIGVAIEAAENREELSVALETAQQLTEESQAQQEEMEALNEELEEQNALLNEEKRKVEQTQQELKAQAESLALASRYKSEFLSNMSHELRTPLNSLLLLARGLADNKDNSLREDQVQSAQIIYQSGHDLLDLINEILDLSKIEAGRMDLNIETTFIEHLSESIQTGFKHMAQEKGLNLEVTIDKSAPKSINTDRKRLEQIIKNLLSNAIKFTDIGSIQVTFTAPTNNETYALAVHVTDTGIGIPDNEQQRVFEAFKQADGSSNRKFGGTGLGLSISRELATLLGSKIQLQSEPGKGSTFSILLPHETVSTTNKDTLNLQPIIVNKPKETAAEILDVADDRNSINQGDRTLLIVEDDLAFLDILMKECRKHKFKCLASTTGETALKLANEYYPNAIILDIMLPDISGWQVLEQLKQNIETRHIPVHISSVLDPDYTAMRCGAVGYLQKPVSRESLDNVLARIDNIVDSKTRNLLVVEDDHSSRHAITQLIGDSGIEIDEAETGEAAYKAIKNKQYDCVILDLGLPDMDGRDLLKMVTMDINIENPPIVIYTGRELSRDEELKLRDYSDSIIIKDARSEERLLDEASLFLHRVVSELPENKREQIENLYKTEELLQGKRILIVDDDMRTLFALTRVLTEYGIDAIKADGGERALELLDATQDIDLILMDMMMPGLDGYQTMERIRRQKRFESIPIIALTAKAMPEDRLQCINAGANDYMTKPVQPTNLASLLRVWLYR